MTEIRLLLPRVCLEITFRIHRSQILVPLVPVGKKDTLNKTDPPDKLVSSCQYYLRRLVRRRFPVNVHRSVYLSTYNRPFVH